MATLTNTKIKDTYPGLIKLEDNGAVQPTALKQLTDGTGGSLPIQISQIETKFSGAVDLTGVTVTGLPSAAGLINGVGANSLISSPDLTTNAPSATKEGQIAIGNDASCGLPVGAIAIGSSASAGGGTAIGNGARCSGATAASYGANARSLGSGSVAVGGNALVISTSPGGVAIGEDAEVALNTPGAVALGKDTIANAVGAVALGAAVTASTANTVTIKKLQMLDYATLDYADDAAAATGGIPLGGVYHTDGALKIRIV